ncbi:MAG: twin-arginine translocation signal domain-containing protein [Nitriliruptorales bacterium]|nr:twin-arginine translocation signal domain-containing protein [Nitriliruptorales bacterium]
MRSITQPRSLLSRRDVLRSTGAVGAGLALAACGGNGEPADGGTDSPTAGGQTGEPVDGNDAVQEAFDAAGVSAEPTLTVLSATFETVAGTEERIQFALRDQEMQPVLDAQVEAHLVSAADRSVVVGPASPTYYAGQFSDQGLYVFEQTVDEAGLYDLVVATSDGQQAGTAVLSVVTPEQAQVILPGEPVPSVDTPTVDDKKNLEELCTRDPDCGMHETSLADALEQGRPVVLTIATPKYCQTRVCGPVVDVVLATKEQVQRDDIVFIHTEVFSDAGATPTEIVTALELPAEPWTFLIDADGRVADRFFNAIVADVLTPAVEAL